MLDVKSAVESALKFFDEMYPGNDFKDILLEEVDLSEDGKFWNITIGFSRRSSESANSFSRITQGLSDFIRVNKVFKVNVIDGTVKSMKSREHA
jgi:hypothetical protein